jgi:fatty acid desaturase
MSVDRRVRLSLRTLVLGYLGVLLLVPVGLVLYRTFEHGVTPVWQSITTPAAVHAFWLTLEIALIAARMAIVVGAVFWVLPVGMAFAFLGVQLAVFGVYMGASFAPNHIGMEVVPEGAKLDFLSKQVLTGRNVTGGFWMTAFMGGLNFQIEHHLFPNMPSGNLRRARPIVKAYCAELGVPYTETTLLQSWAIVVRYIHRVGIRHADPFDCPAAANFRSA